MIAAKKTVSDLLKRTRSAGDELREGVTSVRSRIADLKDDRAKLEALPPTEEVAHARIDALIASLMVLPRERTPEPEHFTWGPSHYHEPRPDRFDLLFRYLAPQLADAMKAEVSALYADAPGMNDAERAEQIERIDRDLLDAELAEESILRAAEAAGFPMLRRRDADPRAVLAHENSLP